MSTPYQFTPRIPSAPHPTPLSNYKLPPVKSTRPPVQNPYEKFTQPEFDAWIGGITSALKQALGQEEEERPKPDKRDPQTFVRTQTNLFDDANDLSDDHIDDSFAEVKARRAAGKGKARDPREGPGFGKGDSSNPIDLVSSDEEDAEEVQLIITADYGSESEGEEDLGILSDQEYSWERGQASSPPAPSPTPQEALELRGRDVEEEGYRSEDYEDEEEAQYEEYEEYDEEEYYDKNDGDEGHTQKSHPEAIDLSSDNDEIEEEVSENEEPPRKIRKISPQRPDEEEDESIWSDEEGETNEDFEGEQPSRENLWARSSERVQRKREPQHSPEVINLDSDEEVQSDEGESLGYENVGLHQTTSKAHSPKHVNQKVNDEEFLADDLGEDNGEEYVEEDEDERVDEDGVGTFPILSAGGLTSAVLPEYDGRNHVQAIDEDDEIQEIQPMEDDTSFPPQRSVSPFETNMPDISDPWSGPRTYAEDYYSGGDVQIPLDGTINAHHLGPNDEDSTTDQVMNSNLEDDVIQPIKENTAFPPSTEDGEAPVDISDPWEGPQLYAEDFYSGGPVQRHGGLTTAHYLGPTDVDTLNDFVHDAVPQEKEMNEDEEMQPQEADTSFPQGDGDSEGFIDIADPWIGPQTFAEDYYSGGDVRTLPGAPIDPALLSGTGDVEDDIDSFLTPGALSPSQFKATNDDGEIETDEENQIIQPPPATQGHVSSPRTQSNVPLPTEADIIAIEDSEEDKERPVDELDELDDEDEDDNISLKYPDFGEEHQPMAMEVEEDENENNQGMAHPIQLNEEALLDVGAMNSQFEGEGEEMFDLAEPLDANISVTVGHVEEVEDETVSHTTQDQDIPEIQLLDEPQDNHISINDELETDISHPLHIVESDSIPQPEEEVIIKRDAESDTQIGPPSETVLVKDQDGATSDLERNVETQSTPQEQNEIAALDHTLAEDSTLTDIEAVVEDSNTVETTGFAMSEQEALANPVDSIVQESEEEAIESISGVEITIPEDPSTHLSSSDAAAVASPATQTSGQLPTPPSEKNRCVSLPPENHNESAVEPCSREAASEAAAVPILSDEFSQATDNFDTIGTIQHTVIEATEYDTEKDADRKFDHVGEDIDIKSAHPGEDVDDLPFSVEEPMTEGRLTVEPPERQMSLGVVSLPSGEMTEIGYDEDMETSPALPRNEPMDLEAATVSQVSQDGLGMHSEMETIEHPAIESAPKISKNEDEIVVPIDTDADVLDSIDLALSTGKPGDPLSSKVPEIQTSSLENVADISETSREVDEPSTSMELSGEAMEVNSESQPAPIQIVQHELSVQEATPSTESQPVESDQISSTGILSAPTEDVFGVSPLASDLEGRTGPDDREAGPASLPYRAPSSSSRVFLSRQPTDPVLMADPYPYCLSTPNTSPYPRTVNPPDEVSVGTSGKQSDSGGTSPQIDQEGMNDEGARDDGVLTPKSNMESQSDIFAATTEEESLGAASKPTRKRKRTTGLAKSHQVTASEAGDETSPSVVGSPQKASAKESNTGSKKRTKERKSGPRSSNISRKKKSSRITPETTSYETILVNPRSEVKQGESSQQATSVTMGQIESPAPSSANISRKIFPPANTSSVVSPAPSHRSYTSQPSPTVNKPSILPHPNAASESLLHAHGQKRKAFPSQVVQQSLSPRAQTKLPQLSRFPSAPLIGPDQPSSSASVIPPLDTTKLPSFPSASASAISPTEKASITASVKPVTPIPKANSMSARPSTRSTHVTRSHCRYHKISLPREEGGPRVSFLVPGCSLNDKELMSEEEIVDHGDATMDDSRNMLKDIETLGFSLDLIGVLRQLVGLDILREQEIFYLPQPGEIVTRRVPLQKSASTIRAPVDGSSQAGSPGGYSHSNSIMASPGPNRPPHSASSWSESPSLSSLLRQPPIVAGSELAETDRGYISSERDFETESDSSDEDPGKDVKPSTSEITTSKAKGKPARKNKGRKGADRTYEPDQDQDDEESDAPTSTKKRRKSTRGIKRNRDSDAIPVGNDGDEREAKKPKTEMDTSLEPATLAQPQNPII